MFTLVHELAHIWIAETGISNKIEPEELQDKDKFHPVELFCNEIAANSLMPKEKVVNLTPYTFKDSKELFKAAKQFGVSSFALLVRILKLDLISTATYLKLKRQVDYDFTEYLRKEEEKNANQKENRGGLNYFLLQLNRNSKLFTQTVLDSFRGGHIEATLASSLLNVQVNKFHKLEAQLYR